MFSRQATKRFSDTVDPGESLDLSTTLDDPATAEAIRVRFYQGPELDLTIEPYRERASDRLPLVDLYGRDVLVGDDDHFEFEISEQLHEDDTLGVVATNNSTEYAYDFNLDITVEYAGGVSRALSSLTGVL
jgi:hypothetical protein